MVPPHKELSNNAQFTLGTGTKVYLANAYPPWQHPTNNNPGRVPAPLPPRQRPIQMGASDLQRISLRLNNWFRKVFGFQNPSRIV